MITTINGTVRSSFFTPKIIGKNIFGDNMITGKINMHFGTRDPRFQLHRGGSIPPWTTHHTTLTTRSVLCVVCGRSKIKLKSAVLSCGCNTTPLQTRMNRSNSKKLILLYLLFVLILQSRSRIVWSCSQECEVNLLIYYLIFLIS